MTAELQEIFKGIDRDGSGFITADELKAAMAKVGVKLSDAEIDEMIQAADKDADGRINYEGNSKWKFSLGLESLKFIQKHMF